jgi:hypothetical protein
MVYGVTIWVGRSSFAPGRAHGVGSLPRMDGFVRPSGNASRIRRPGRETVSWPIALCDQLAIMCKEGWYAHL